LNLHGVAPTWTWTMRVCHSATPAWRRAEE